MTQAKSSKMLLHIPTALKDRLAVDAAVRGITIRAVILQALFDAGYDVPSEERRDKRKTRVHVKSSKQSAFEAADISDNCTTL